jgi:hypothetical protein
LRNPVAWINAAVGSVAAVAAEPPVASTSAPELIAA